MGKLYPFISSLVFLLLIQLAAFAQFEFNTNCEKAYENILALRINDAKSIIEKEKTANPNNLTVLYLENFIDFFTIFLNENKEEFKNLEANKDIRLKKLDDGAKKSNSPYYLFIKAEIELQWAFARLKFGEFLSAAYEIYKAYNHLEKNIKKYPDFSPNYKSMGLLHTLIGSIPDKYKWGADLIGMDGDLDQGIKELTALMKNPPTEYKHIDSEVKILLSFILKYYRMFDHNSWQYLNATKQDSSSLLWVFCKADELMVKRENETVIELLENRPKDEAYFPFYFLDYLTGISKLKRLDSNANEPLEYFLNNFNGLNYIKSAYQKLAWHYLINDNLEKYHYYINFCKDKGDTFIDDDVQALKELESGVIPHKDILKARLLFDGGYFEKAEKILDEIPEKSLNTAKDKVELTYRKARLLHEWGKPDEAVPYYDQTLVNGIELKYYFAANSALQLGYISEESQDYKKAKIHYEKCIDIHDHGYKSYLEFKAKLALNKLENDHPDIFN
ncbi:MAG: hypothetical protein COC01_03860 [Bacteroidetes bacterium]|nr:MAG: hypothetical protein COC01_03860 [Bacteroidota bacterium]